MSGIGDVEIPIPGNDFGNGQQFLCSVICKVDPARDAGSQTRFFQEFIRLVGTIGEDHDSLKVIFEANDEFIDSLLAIVVAAGISVERSMKICPLMLAATFVNKPVCSEITDHFIRFLFGIITTSHNHHFCVGIFFCVSGLALLLSVLL